MNPIATASPSPHLVAPAVAKKKTPARQAAGERPFVATASSSGRVVLMATARVVDETSATAAAASAAAPAHKKRRPPSCARGGGQSAPLAAVGGSAPYAYEAMQKQRFAAEMRLAAERLGFTLPLQYIG